MPGKVIWITGLSGSGKTTLANMLKPYIKEPAIVLDGDSVRKVLSYADFGFDFDSRRRIGFTYAKLAKFLAEQNINVICAVMVMIEEVRQWNKQNIQNYTEVFLDITTAELGKRDYKGIYDKTNNVVGKDIKAELPSSPDLILPYTNSAEQNLVLLVDYLKVFKMHQ